MPNDSDLLTLPEPDLMVAKRPDAPVVYPYQKSLHDAVRNSLRGANNLSDIASPATARTNLGVSFGKQTIWVPATAMFGSGLPALLTSLGGATVPTIALDPATNEFLFFTVATPKSWDEGNISYQVYWAHPATTTNFTTVWTLEAGAFSNDDAFSNTFNSASVTDTGGTTHDLYISPESSGFTPANAAEGDLTRFTFFRDAANGSDTLAVDAYLIGVKILYTTNASNDT